MNKKIIEDIYIWGEVMFDREHRRINKRCVSVRAFEEEPEYYSFADNYDYGDVDYGQDND